MDHYTLWNPAIGGILIGLASLLATALSGKIPGISGVFGRLFVPATPDKTWRLVFLLGLIGGAALSFAFWQSAAPLSTNAVARRHGDCRFARRIWHSPRRRLHERTRRLRGRDGREKFDRGHNHLRRSRRGDGFHLSPNHPMKAGKLFLILVAGALFGSGLAISGMTDPARVIGFLDVFGAWDPALLFVMAGAVGIYGFGMLVLRRFGNRSLRLPPAASSPIDCRLVLGAAIFGLGWGLGGFCPGPALANLGALRLEALLFVPAMAIGMLFAQRLFGADN